MYCKSCFRSYTKWESYRKHVQRGCKIMPCSTAGNVSSSSLQLESDEDIGIDSSLDLNIVNSSTSTPVSEKWHEATFILSIKEKHILSQVAVDYVLSTTNIFVSEIFSRLLEDVCDDMPTNVMQILKNKVRHISDNLFKGLNTAFLQKKYFREHFGLIVS